MPNIEIGSADCMAWRREADEIVVYLINRRPSILASIGSACVEVPISGFGPDFSRREMGLSCFLIILSNSAFWCK